MVYMLNFQQKIGFKKVRDYLSQNVTICYFIFVFLYANLIFLLITYWVLPNTVGSIGDPDYYRDLASENLLSIKMLGWQQFQLRPGGQGPAGVATLLFFLFNHKIIIIVFNALIHTLSIFILYLLFFVSLLLY